MLTDSHCKYSTRESLLQIFILISNILLRYFVAKVLILFTPREKTATKDKKKRKKLLKEGQNNDFYVKKAYYISVKAKKAIYLPSEIWNNISLQHKIYKQNDKSRHCKRDCKEDRY